jgi:hypothetical protein
MDYEVDSSLFYHPCNLQLNDSFNDKFTNLSYKLNEFDPWEFGQPEHSKLIRTSYGVLSTSIEWIETQVGQIGWAKNDSRYGKHQTIEICLLLHSDHLLVVSLGRLLFEIRPKLDFIDLTVNILSS